MTYFLGQSVLRSFWDQVFTAFWQRYPNPCGKDVSTEDSATSDQKLLSRQLLTKTNRMPRWSERLFPANTMTTFTWNINHARLMVVEERCTKIRQEAWVSSSLFGVSRAVQEFGLVRFKSNVTKTMKGFEYTLAKLQGEEAKGKATETALAATEKAKDPAGKAADKQQQQFMWPAQAPDSSLADYRLQSLWPSSCASSLKASFQPCRLSGWWAGGRCAAWHLQHSRLVTHV
ncbi:hypothetical protein FD755_003848 [Muntiacus reevesi]|uniref:PRELI/MSF1 domain-containing protein n=1 Tax=Muntiacus reevesi TaxID=9886 RepID=A0A5J5MNI9_MUNRE|nr:hypothetical protein FD755_003848 [Muntiacus reevesi]